MFPLPSAEHNRNFLAGRRRGPALFALATDGGVDAEAAGSLPREHAVGVGFVEQADPPLVDAPSEVAQHATLHDVLKLVPVLGRESGGLMEAHLTVIGRREHAIEHHDVEVGVEGCAGSMKEGGPARDP